MKYLQTGSHQKNLLMRLSLGGALVFLLGLWVSSFGMYFSRLSLDPASVVTYYRGSDETFQPARTFGSMVEVTHGHMAMMGVTLLLLTHLAIFLPLGTRIKVIGIAGTFASAFLNEASGWLVRFVHPGFAPLKPLAFLVSQTLQAVLLVMLGAALLLPAAHQEKRTEGPPEPVPAGDSGLDPAV